MDTRYDLAVYSVIIRVNRSCILNWFGKGTSGFAEGNSIFFFLSFFLLLLLLLLLLGSFCSVFVYFCQGLFKLSKLFFCTCVSSREYVACLLCTTRLI